MTVLECAIIPALYTFEEHGGDKGRTPESISSVSISTIKSYVASKLGVSNYKVDFDSPDIKNKAWLGLAFEDRLFQDIKRTEPDHLPHPGEFHSASGKVMGHPDGFYYASGGLRSGDFGVDEIKHTYTSLSAYSSASCWFETSAGLAWDYLFQLRSYCAILRSIGLDVREGRIWILCACGDYKTNRGPVLTRTHFSFSEKELDNQLRMLETDAEVAYKWKYGEQGAA